MLWLGQTGNTAGLPKAKFIVLAGCVGISRMTAHPIETPFTWLHRFNSRNINLKKPRRANYPAGLPYYLFTEMIHQPFVFPGLRSFS